MPFLSLSLDIRSPKLVQSNNFAYGEYFYDFTEVGQSEITQSSDSVISDYLTAQGSSNTNYFQSELLSTSASSNIEKIDISFYSPVVVTADNAVAGIRHVLIERADTNSFGILLGRISTVAPLDTDLEIISLVSDGNIWYIDSTSITEISIGFHTLSIVWDSVNTRYNFIYDGTSYAGKFTVSAVRATINNYALRIMRRAANISVGSLYPPAGAYVAKLDIYNTSNEFIYSFKNLYGANNTDYEWNGFTTTRYVGDATKRLTITTPSDYRIENSSPNKPDFVLGSGLEFNGTNNSMTFTAIDEDELTIAFWFEQTTQDATFRYFFSSGISGANGEGLRISNGNISYYDGSGATTLYTLVASESLNYIAFTRNVNTKLVQLYVNKVNVYSNTISNVSTGRIDRIGTLISSNYINGVFYDVAIWNTVLSSTDIENLYNKGNGDFATNHSFANLQAYWRMNGVSGDNTAIDEQSTYDGTLNNFDTSTCWIRRYYHKELSPRTGIAASFDGSAYITSTSTDFNFGNEPVTYYAVVKFNTAGTYAGGIFGKWIDTGNNRAFFLRKTPAEQIYAAVSHDGNLYEVISTGSIIEIGKTYHIAFVYDGSALKLSINGGDFTTKAYTLGFYSATTAPFSIGAAHQLGNLLDGTIYNALVIKKALSLSEIEQLIVRPELTKNYLVNTVGINWADVAAFYPLTENGGTTAYDYSDNANHGTWTNPAWETGLSKGRQLGLQNVSQYLKLDGVDDELTLTTYTSPTANDGFSIVYKFIPYGLSPLAAEQHVLSTSSTDVSQFYYRINNLAIKLNSSYTVFITPTTNFVNGAINTVVITFDSGNLSDVTINGETPSSTTNTSPGARTYQIDTLFEFAPSTGNGFEDIPLSFQVYEGVLSSDEIDYINADVNNDVRDFNGFSLTEGFVFTNKGDYSNWEKVGISGDSFAGTPETITLPEKGYGVKMLEWDGTDYGFSCVEPLGIGTGDFTLHVRLRADDTSGFRIFNAGGYMLYLDSFYIYCGGFGGLGTNSYTAGTIMDVILVRDNGNLTAWVNGVQKGTTINTVTFNTLTHITGSGSGGTQVINGVIYEAQLWNSANGDKVDKLYNDGKVLDNPSDIIASPIVELKYFQENGDGINISLTPSGSSPGENKVIVDSVIPDSDRVAYDPFLLECNSKNLIGEEETLALRGLGYVDYDGHAGSYTDVKQIQFMIKPTSSNHAYVLTDEENNRVVYINSNQVVSDFGLNSVYINDIETNVVLTDVWQQVTIEFYGAYTFEKLFIGSSAVPDAFEEFGIDKLNIVKNSSFNLLETFDFIVNADNQLVTDGEDITTIYNAGNDKSIRIISSSTSILDKPQLSTDNRFGGSPYITMKSGSYFTLNNAFNFKSNFTIFWVLNNNSARPLVQMSSSTGSPLSFQSANNLGIYIYTPTGVFLSTYDEEIETILTITYNGTTITLYQNGVFKGSKFSGLINSFDHIGRHAYEGDYYLATLAIDNRLLNNEELNSVGSELATKYGITWNNI